jgi:hypothetical protein
VIRRLLLAALLADTAITVACFAASFLVAGGVCVAIGLLLLGLAGKAAHPNRWDRTS